MPTKIGWLVENRVIYSQSWNVLDTPMLEAHADFILELLEQEQDTSVYLVIDTLKLVKFKTDIVKLKAQTQRYLTHPRLIWNIDVTRHVKNQMLGNVVSNIAGIKWKTCDNLIVALSHLNEIDESLPALDTTCLTTFEPLKVIH